MFGKCLIFAVALVAAIGPAGAQERTTKDGQPFCGDPDELVSMTKSRLLREPGGQSPTCAGLVAGISYRIIREVRSSDAMSVVEVVVRVPGNEPMVAYTWELK